MTEPVLEWINPFSSSRHNLLSAWLRGHRIIPSSVSLRTNPFEVSMKYQEDILRLCSPDPSSSAETNLKVWLSPLWCGNMQIAEPISIKPSSTSKTKSFKYEQIAPPSILNLWLSPPWASLHPVKPTPWLLLLPGMSMTEPVLEWINPFSSSRHNLLSAWLRGLRIIPSSVSLRTNPFEVSMKYQEDILTLCSPDPSSSAETNLKVWLSPLWCGNMQIAEPISIKPSSTSKTKSFKYEQIAPPSILNLWLSPPWASLHPVKPTPWLLLLPGMSMTEPVLEWISPFSSSRHNLLSAWLRWLRMIPSSVSLRTNPFEVSMKCQEDILN